MKITNVKKFKRSILMILGIFVVLILLIGKSSYSHKEIEYKTICVEAGDTLWNIACLESETNSYYTNKDIRFIVDDIIEQNNLNSNNLKINQRLIIPIL